MLKAAVLRVPQLLLCDEYATEVGRPLTSICTPAQHASLTMLKARRRPCSWLRL